MPYGRPFNFLDALADEEQKCSPETHPRLKPLNFKSTPTVRSDAEEIE